MPTQATDLKNTPITPQTSLQPISNAELELAFREVMAREAPAIELEFLETHPELFTWGLLCFVRGCDWTNAHYVNVIDRALEKLS